MANRASEGDVWYADGLRFECTGCGRCCTGGDGYVWVSVEEAQDLAARLELELEEFGRQYLRRFADRYALVNGPGGDCVFLRGKTCGVYEQRPAQCRAFPWWPANLRSDSAWRLAAQTCEGIRDEAPMVPREVIEPALASAREAGLAAGFAGDENREEEGKRAPRARGTSVDSPPGPPHLAPS